MEARPSARRIEVYGSTGSVIMEPFEPAREVRLHLEEAAGGFDRGENVVPIATQSRQELYERELAAFVAHLAGESSPDRPFEHEVLVQETLLRATGAIPEGVGGDVR
jgi:predicted dehydrogenase